MIKLSKKFIAVNIGAGAIMVAAFVSFMQTTFTRPNVPVCSSRYHHQLSFELGRDGAAVTVADVQAALNGQDEGIADNLTISEFSEGPSRFAMGVKIAPGTAAQRSSRTPAGGISMPWTPTLLEQPHAACLSYDVFLPADFNFDLGGTLPGLFGGPVEPSAPDAARFAVNLAWHGGGAPKLYIETKAGEYQRAGTFAAYMSKLPRGRWIHIDQELVLNGAGASDGLARLWIDGKIESDVKGAWLREGKDATITGVSGDVYFGGSGTEGVAKSEATIWISPFVLRWNG